MTTEAKTGHPFEDEGGYATIEEIHENLFGFIPAVRRAIGLSAVKGSRVKRDESNGHS